MGIFRRISNGTTTDGDSTELKGWIFFIFMLGIGIGLIMYHLLGGI